MTNVDPIIIAVANAMIEDAIKEHQEKENLLDNLLGKKYIPRDNSYIHEIIDGCKMDWHCDLIGVSCRIISRPYITTVSTCGRSHKERMIKVQSNRTHFIYEVPFNESWIRS